MRAVALWSFAPTASGQLSFAVDEVLLLIREETTQPGWGFARTMARQPPDEGFVPLSYLRKLAPDEQVRSEQDAEEKLESLSAPMSSLDEERLVLLAWIQHKIPDFYVENFGSSWRDGRALLALINSLAPGTFDLASQIFATPEENAELGISTADSLLDIAQSVSASELCDESFPSDRIALYLQGFHCKQRQLLDEADTRERLLRHRGGIHKQLRSKPPRDQVWCNIIGKSGKFHASISLQGVVQNRFGDIVGFLNLEAKKAASAAEELIGYTLEESLYDCRMNAGGADGVFCGEVNLGVGSIHDRNGSTLMTFEPDGTCRGQTQVYLGQFEDCGPEEIMILALYIFFLDPEFYDEEAEDEEPRELIPAPENAIVNVFGKEGEFQFAILDDENGSVIDCFGDEIGFCDVKGKRVASAAGEILGSILGDTIVGPEDEHLGEVDRGQGLVFNDNGSSILELESTGHARGVTSVYLGEFRGFSFADIETVALLVLCLQQTFLQEC